jgi:serine/threonine protein kinase
MKMVGTFLNGGAYGEVHAYPQDNRAVKLSAIKDNDINTVQAVVRELHVLRLSSRYLVPFRGAELRYGSTELHMELMQSDLKKIIADEKATVSEAMVTQISTDMLHGLHFLHAHDITHRDIKPDNVLIKNGRAYLCDFGLSKPHCTVARKTCMTDYMVTRWYRAPEVCRQQGYNHKVDLWAMGCIVYELCWRKPMFYLPKNFKDAQLETFIKRIPEKLQRVKYDKLRELIAGTVCVALDDRWDAATGLKHMTGTDAPVYTKAYYTGSIIADAKWKTRFKKYVDHYPKLKSVILHALMLFERTGMTDTDFKIAMTVSYMLYEKFPSREGFIDSLALRKDRKKKSSTDVTYTQMARWVCRYMDRPTMFHEYEKTKDVDAIFATMCPGESVRTAKRQRVV